MSGLLLGAGMPFLGPVIVAWIVLIVGVMTAYYLLVVRYHGPKEVADPPEWRQPMATEATERPAPWAQPSRPVAASAQLTAYDMENFPDDNWGRSSRTS
ncbi:MAG: hypothetical protein QOF20_1651 [Acidimicrobiaceae bacterium]|nr:hypothetical protein [Acidimicrobiaceae bacterium]